MKVVFLKNYDSEKDMVIGFHNDYSGEPCVYRFEQIENIPEIPENTSKIYMSKITKEFIFEPIKQEINEIEILKEKINLIQQALDDLILNGGAL